MMYVVVGTGELPQNIKKTIGALEPLFAPEKGTLEALVRGASLFAESKSYLVAELSDEASEFVVKNISDVAQSKNTFVVSFETLTKPTRKVFEDAGIVIVEHKKVANKEIPTVFSITNAYANDDKVLAWRNLLQELERGTEPEVIHGTLLWMIKSAYIVSRFKTDATALAVTPYAQQKLGTLAKRKDLPSLYQELIRMSAYSHRGKMDFTTALELFILKTL